MSAEWMASLRVEIPNQIDAWLKSMRDLQHALDNCAVGEVGNTRGIPLERFLFS